MSITSDKVLIHVGMPKCASTSIQANFWQKLPTVHYAGILDDSALTKAIHRIVRQDEFYYSSQEIQEEIEAQVDFNKLLVISDESSCGWIIPLINKIPQPRKVIADRYKELFPNARILIILRNQLEMHKSLYVERLFTERKFISSGNIDFKSWIDLNIDRYEKGWSSALEFLDYSPLVQYYRDNFKDVKVVLFEDVVSDMTKFISRQLCNFMGLDTEESMSYFNDEHRNKRHSKSKIAAKLIVSKSIVFLQNRLGNPQSIIPLEKRKQLMNNVHSVIDSLSVGKIKTEYTENQIAYLTSFYKNGNKKLVDDLEMDLRKYRYPL